jgi:hypothetical protein
MSLQSFCSVPAGIVDGSAAHCLIKSNDIKFTGYKSTTMSNASGHTEKPDMGMDGESTAPTAPTASTAPNHTFTPNRFDSLYWCIYAGIHGIGAYEDSARNEFIIEKNDKYRYIEQIQKCDVLKGTLKAKSISHQHVLDTLIGKRRIDIITCIAIAIIENIDVWIESEHTFVRHTGGGDGGGACDGASTELLIRRKTGSSYELFSGDVRGITDEIVSTKYEVVDISKPIKGFSTYSLSDLQDIATKVDVDLFGDNGKKKTKRTLYTEVSMKIFTDKN